MYIKQLYTSCLSEAAYFIGSEGQAAVIDPMREIAPYMELAKERKASILYIFETHFHADFISGHLDLAKQTGATIVYGPETNTTFPIHLAKDGEEFRIGKLTIKAMHTPGHTPESTCYLLSDEQGRPHCIFTGDTLFVGDVGRPDLFNGGLGKEEMAEQLYDSLQKLKALPDDVIIYPAHGAGSSCGKHIGAEAYSTIGKQKAENYAMRQTDKASFIREVTEGLDAAPQYFPLNARMNREGYTALDKILDQGLTPLTVEDVKEKVLQGAWILDTRAASEFAKGFIPGAVNIGLEGRFAEWVATLFPFDVPVVLVTDSGKESEAIVRMARVGFDRVAGYLAGGFAKWQEAGEPVDLVIEVEPDEVLMDIPYDNNMLIVDVRKEAEFANEHVRGALNLPLNDMADPAVLAQLDERDNLYVHCQSGYRSMVACSVMKKEGFHNLRNITGGFNHLKETPGIALEKDEQAMN